MCSSVCAGFPYCRAEPGQFWGGYIPKWPCLDESPQLESDQSKININAMFLPPEDRIRHKRDGSPVLLPNPATWPYTPEMIDVIARRRNSSALISGPTGSGKEELAEVLAAKDQEFTAINCVGLDGPLIESELFGHKKGAFTGAETDRKGILASAGNGTVFLDEIGRMPIASQARLLRYMQTGEIRPVGGDKPLPTKTRARIIAATNQHVHNTKLFLPDLLQRFDFHIEVPPLSDRGADALYLLTLPQFAPEGDAFTAVSLGAVCSVLLYEWPGNIRELMKFRRHAHVFQSLPGPGCVPDDPWPAHVLHRQPQRDGVAQFQSSARLELFCEYSVYALEKLFSNPGFAEDIKKEEKFQRTAAVLQSIPWILYNQPFAIPPGFSPQRPLHPQILPFSYFQSVTHDVKYDLSVLLFEMTQVDIRNIPDNSSYGPIQSASLPYFLEMLTKLFNEARNFPFGVDKREYIDRFAFDPPVQAMLEQTNYVETEKPTTAATKFETALSTARLDEKSKAVCRAVFSGKQAGKPPKDIAVSLCMPSSTLRAKIANICRDNADLKKFIWTPPGRPAKKTK